MRIGITRACVAGLLVAIGLASSTACGVSPQVGVSPISPLASATRAAATPSARPAVTVAVGTAIAGTAVVVPPGGGTPATVLTPTPFPTAPGTARTVTLADDGKPVELQVGQRFLLALGTGWEWTVTIADPTVVSRVENATVVEGAQGIYEAKRAGRTTFTAVGDLPCRKAQPPCLAPSRVFETEVVVK